MFIDISSSLELPKHMTVKTARQPSGPHHSAAEGSCTDSSDVDSAYEGCSNSIQGPWKQTQQACSRPGGSCAARACLDLTASFTPRSACSTPGGADNSMGIQLHALVFSTQQQRQQRSSTDSGPHSARFHNQQISLGSSGRTRSGPVRTRTSSDLSRGSADCTNSWSTSSHARGGYVLQSLTALGMNGSPRRGGSCARGSISKAKQILAEAVNSMPGDHGSGPFPLSTCDTGVLSPLLSIIRQNGAVSCRSSLSDAASSCSSGSAACGLTCRSSSRCLHSSGSSLSGTSRGCSARLSRASSSCEGDCCSYSSIPPILPEEEPSELCSDSPVDFLQQRQQAAQLQKVIDCIDTVRYLAMDDSNRMALIDLGAVDLLLSKLQPAAKPAPQVIISCLAALSQVCKHDVMKQQLWDNSDSAVILQLLSSRQNTPAVKAAHHAVMQLGWSVDSAYGSCCTSSITGSIFDSVTSHISSADSSSSMCSGANVLLEPAIIPALAEALHPAADVPVLMSALKLLSKAAASDDFDASAPAVGPDINSIAEQPALKRQQQVNWNKVLFALMPLLIPTQRRQGHLVLSAALELLVVLTERYLELQPAVCAAGCLPPLLVQVLEGHSEQSLQAACILTGIVDCSAAQDRLAQEPALALLLRVVQNKERSVDVQLAAVHVLRRLATCVPKTAALLKLQGAASVIVAMVQEVPDQEVRRAAGGLLQLLGTPVVFRPRQGRSLDYGSRAFSKQHRVPHQTQQHVQQQRHKPYVQQPQPQQWQLSQLYGSMGVVAAGCCAARSQF
eukprot:GHUV01002957.1.p1 GENE.GHUV01002957.1~~GHUV01002957.1.p1  ORF type:complete len:788 (+),score=265.99 GHUV01002957.1:973-3336(+)